jgi:hypothetical protein
MNLKRRLRLTHGGVRVRLGRKRLENPLDLARRGLAEPVAGY